MAYHCVAFILIAQPCFEKFQSPKTADAIWMAVMAAIGYKTLDGTLNKWVAAALWLGNGAQFWLAPKSTLGTFSAEGYDGQRLLIVPGLDLVIVRLGRTSPEKMMSVNRFLVDLIRCFPAPE